MFIDLLSTNYIMVTHLDIWVLGKIACPFKIVLDILFNKYAQDYLIMKQTCSCWPELRCSEIIWYFCLVDIQMIFFSDKHLIPTLLLYLPAIY